MTEGRGEPEGGVDHFQTFSDAQEYLARRLGGVPFDYPRDDQRTRIAAERLGVWPAVEAAIALSRSTDKAIDAAVARGRKRLPEVPEGRTLTDVGNAHRFVEAHGLDARYVAELAQWHCWDGLHWQPDRDGEIERRAMATARAIYAEAAAAPTASEARAIAKHARSTEQHAALKAMLSLARAIEGMTISQAELDADPWLLGVQNGVVDLRTGDLVEARREQFITRRAATHLDPEAECPTFERFVSEIMGGREALVAYIQRLIGYCLTGRTDEQIIAFLFGVGANGKSVFLTTFRGLLGGYAQHAAAETLMVRRDEAPRPDIARLRGARLVTSTESEDGKRLAEAQIKTLTGGDPVTARHLYREEIEFRPECKILLATNHRPVIRGSDEGIWRRIHLVPFAVTIPPERRDKDLPAKLRAEWPGILAWAVRGCLEWQATGLAPPEEVQQATQEYREDSDLVGRWIAERCIVGRGAQVQAAVAYRDYSRWIEAQGAHPMSLMSFSRLLNERGFDKRKSGVVTFYGVGLLADESQAEGGLPL